MHCLPAHRGDESADHGVTVICAGRGGIPVTATAAGDLRGVEAVIDKDLAAARLAVELDADALLLLTDVDAVYADWGTDAARPLHETTVDELRARPLPAGSMAPKVEAICSFVEHGGWLGAIGSLSDAAAVLRGEAGTRVWGAGGQAAVTAAAAQPQRLELHWRRNDGRSEPQATGAGS